MLTIFCGARPLAGVVQRFELGGNRRISGQHRPW